MNSLFVFVLTLLTANVTVAAVRDLSGLYDFLDCSCTTLRCLEPSFYRLIQTANGAFTINYQGNRLAAYGNVTEINNGRQTRVSMRWLPGMDFNTNCTAAWVPNRRSMDLRCGDQYRYCTAQFKCRDQSGPCALRSSAAASRQPLHILSQIMTFAAFAWSGMQW